MCSGNVQDEPCWEPRTGNTDENLVIPASKAVSKDYVDMPTRRGSHWPKTGQFESQ